MRIRAVVDVIEAGKVLLLLGEEQDALFWPQHKLPKEIKEGDIVYIDITIDREEAQRLREENQKRLDAMLKRTQEMDKQ